jgi:hypothetical protein
MYRLLSSFIIILISSLAFGSAVKDDKAVNQKGDRQIIAKFLDGGRTFENEYYVTFKPRKGANIQFRVVFPDEKITRLKLFVEKKGMLVPNSKMKNKTFIIHYSKKEMEDENTGESVTGYFINSIMLKN